MADVINFHAGVEAVIPVKAKKPGKRQIDREPVQVTEYAHLGKALDAIALANQAMVQADDAFSVTSKTLLTRVVELFDGLAPVNSLIWDQHFRAKAAATITDKSKLSNVKVALIALTNLGPACIGEHKSLQGFCLAARPVLKDKGLLASGKGGRPTGHGTDKAESSTKAADGPSEPEVKEAVSVSRKVAAAVLANPKGVHEHSKSWAHALHFATEDMDRLEILVEFINETWPDMIYPE